MTSSLLIIIMIAILYLCISYLCYLYKKDKEEMENRILQCEKRIEELRQLLKNYNHGILNNIDIHDKHYNEYFVEINNRFKNLEKKVKTK